MVVREGEEDQCQHHSKQQPLDDKLFTVTTESGSGNRKPEGIRICFNWASMSGKECSASRWRRYRDERRGWKLSNSMERSSRSVSQATRNSAGVFKCLSKHPTSPGLLVVWLPQIRRGTIFQKDVHCRNGDTTLRCFVSSKWRVTPWLQYNWS
jgi:hypothetical protein